MREKQRAAAAFCAALTILLGICAAAHAEGKVPIAENLELTTEKNTPLEGVLRARGGEGAALRFYLTTGPIKGELALEEDGRFVYTPRANKRGRDYFGYRVTDTEGNTSEEATVLIRIAKEKER